MRSERRWLASGLATACVWGSVFGGAAVGWAQTITSASVTGTVRDTSEAVVPAATVEIRNHETNQVQRTITDSRGRFRLQYLPVGHYHLSVQLTGFTTANANLALAVGDQIDVPITLTPAAVIEAVQVEAPVRLVEARRTEMAAAIVTEEIDSLPLNGRNYLDLATLAPNVSRTNLRSTDRFAETSAVPGTGISVAGQRNLGNSFIVDGLSANDDAADLAGTFFSEEVIREFQVVTSGGVAEVGRASGGTISVVTRSGTNRLQGRAYEFFRDAALDARNPLSTRTDPVTQEPREDPLSQHQYGFSSGGPIAKNRTFWFGNVERTQLDRTGIVTIAPPSVAAVNHVLDAVRYGGPRVATGDYTTGYQTTNVFGRIDHEASPASRVQGRYSLYDVGSQNARTAGGLNDVSRGAALEDTDQTIAVNHQTTLSSGAINEARAQYTRSRLGAPVNDLVGPAVNINGVAAFGTATSSPTARDLDVFQGVDTLTVQRGAHLLKAGADFLNNRVTIVFPGAVQGVYTFQSLANFERGAYSTYQQAFGEASQFQSNPNLGLFAQDEWRPRSDVTVNAGVRYDLQWLPEPVRLDTNNVSPRAGVAYSPGAGRTVVRAAAGLYFDRIPLRATSNALQRDGSRYQVAQLSFGQAGAPVFPAVLPSLPSGLLISITNINAGLQDGHSEQASVEVERDIGGQLSVAAGYSYLRGHDLIMSHNVNIPTLTVAQASALGVANLGRPDPRYGNISQYDSLGDSWFHGLTASVFTRPSAWGRVRLSYTLSRAVDDAGNAFFQTPQDSSNVLADKGPSDNDQRHRLVVSGAFDRIPGGVQLGYLFSFATAAPFNVVTGGDRNNDTTVNDRPEGVGRNSARLACFSKVAEACGTSSLDLRVTRRIRIGARHRIDLMVEAFNALNHVNVVNVNNTIGTGPTPSPTFRQVTATADMRQAQLGVRWSF
jgi:Carboxypeptidase regulatory-like domain/TonB dependent receptor